MPVVDRNTRGSGCRKSGYWVSALCFGLAGLLDVAVRAQDAAPAAPAQDPPAAAAPAAPAPAPAPAPIGAPFAATADEQLAGQIALASAEDRLKAEIEAGERAVADAAGNIYSAVLGGKTVRKYDR